MRVRFPTCGNRCDYRRSFHGIIVSADDMAVETSSMILSVDQSMQSNCATADSAVRANQLRLPSVIPEPSRSSNRFEDCENVTAQHF